MYNIRNKMNLKILKHAYFIFKANALNKKIIHKSQYKRIDHLIHQNQTFVLLATEKEEKKLDNEIISIKQFVNNSKYSTFLRLIYKRYFIKLLKYYKIWINAVFIRHIEQESYDNILNELENERAEQDDLIDKYEQCKAYYTNTINDFDIIKKNFCNKCVQENDYILTYKSLCIRPLEDDNEDNFGTLNEDDIRVDSDANFNKPNNINIRSMIAEMEEKIKIAETENVKKTADYEIYIKILNAKKMVNFINIGITGIKTNDSITNIIILILLFVFIQNYKWNIMTQT
jgi:hypothetical protein